jgi:hypothetical protein
VGSNPGVEPASAARGHVGGRWRGARKAGSLSGGGAGGACQEHRVAPMPWGLGSGAERCPSPGGWRRTHVGYL